MKIQNKKYPNISIKLSDGKFYQFINGYCEIPESLVLELKGGDYIFGETSSDAYSKFNPETWTKSKKVIFDGPVGYQNGYGNASTRTAEALSEYTDLYFTSKIWLGTNNEHIRPGVIELLNKKTELIDSYYISIWPAWEFSRKMTQRFIGYTMLECTSIPTKWVDNINEYCERLIVPCEHQVKAFKNSGVKVDVVSIPLGIIPEEHPIKDYTIKDDEFWFGTMGTLTYRKGTDILIRAFLKAFPKDKYPNVKLNVKTLHNGIAYMWFMDKKTFEAERDRIVLNYDPMSPSEIVTDFFHQIDCFVFPTRGEGFGYPPLEAMACGLPTICTKYSGCEEFMDARYSYPLDFEEVPVPNGDWRGYPEDLRREGQMWAEPDEDHLIELMLEVYNNRDRANAKGKKASAFVKKKFSADETAKKIVKYLDQKF